MNNKNSDFIALTKNLRTLSETYGANTPLYNLPKTETDDSSSSLAAALRLVGFIDNTRSVLNNYNLWSNTVAEFSEYMFYWLADMRQQDEDVEESLNK